MKTNSLYSTNINLKMLIKKEVLDLTKEQSKIFKLIFTKKLKTLYIYIYTLLCKSIGTNLLFGKKIFCCISRSGSTKY